MAHSRLAGWLTLAARVLLLARLASIAVNRFNAVIDVGRLTRVATPYREVASACAGLLNRRTVDDGVAFAPALVKKA